MNVVTLAALGLTLLALVVGIPLLRRQPRAQRDATGRGRDGIAFGGADTRYLTANRLWQDAHELAHRRLMVSAAVGAVLGLAVGLIAYGLLGLLAGLLVSGLVFSVQSGGRRVAAGAVGEDLTLAVLKRLPTGYTLFNQLEVPRDGRPPIELDLVVVGPGVVHVVEVKHNHGRIQIRPDAEEWMVAKTGRRGGTYDKRMRNPIRQARGQIDALARHFRGLGFRQWVSGSVVLSHPEARFIPVAHRDIAVLGLDGLLAHIGGLKAGTAISMQGVIDALAALRTSSASLDPPPPPGGRGAAAPQRRIEPSLNRPATAPPAETFMPEQAAAQDAETRYWPLGYALILIATPWMGTPIADAIARFGVYVNESMEAAISGTLVALHLALIHRLNGCDVWRWIAGGLIGLHLGLGALVEQERWLDADAVALIMSVLYLSACALMQELRYEYIFGVPVVPHHRFDLAETEPARYVTVVDNDLATEASDGFEHAYIETVRTKIAYAEYEVVGETWGRKGDRYPRTPRLMWAMPSPAIRCAWMLAWLAAALWLLEQGFRALLEAGEPTG